MLFEHSDTSPSWCGFLEDVYLVLQVPVSILVDCICVSIRASTFLVLYSLKSGLRLIWVVVELNSNLGQYLFHFIFLCYVVQDPNNISVLVIESHHNQSRFSIDAFLTDSSSIYLFITLSKARCISTIKTKSSSFFLCILKWNFPNPLKPYFSELSINNFSPMKLCLSTTMPQVFGNKSCWAYWEVPLQWIIWMVKLVTRYLLKRY